MNRSAAFPSRVLTGSLQWTGGVAVFALLLLLSASVLPMAGCGSEESPREMTRHENVRGKFLGTASEGRDVVVHHEAVEGVMRPMIMSLPVADPGAADSIEKEQPVQFDLVIEGSKIRVENLTPLPDTTTLDLEKR